MFPVLAPGGDIPEGKRGSNNVSLREVLYIILYLTSLIVGLVRITGDIDRLEVRIEARNMLLQQQIDRCSDRIDGILQKGGSDD